MNNSGYYQNPVFPGMDVTPDTPNYGNMKNDFVYESTYLDNILRRNKGKKVTVYISVPGSKDSQDKMFEGIIEETGKDYIILSDPTSGKWHIIPMIFFDYITFEEPINSIKSY